MDFNLISALGIAVAYVIGSIPFGYIVAKQWANIDIREHGSCNVGATNVARVVGKRAGQTVLLLDFLKGLVPVLLAIHVVYPNEPWMHLIISISIILGHCFSVFLKFTGGKAAITSLACLFALEPIIATSVGLMVFVIFKISRMVSLASITAAIITPATMFLLQRPLPYSIYVVSAALLILYRHKANIVRLLNGTENKI